MSDRARSKRILAFDWDGRGLRVVHAFLTKRGVKIDRLLSVAIPGDVDVANPEQMGAHIRRVLNQEGIVTRHAVVDIPRDQAILNTLMLPCRLPEELPAMVEMQIAKELPFPVSEAAIDFAVESQHEDGVTAEVLVAAIRREVLHQYEATFAAAGLRLDRIGLRPYANKVAVCALLKHAMPDRVLIIDVRPTLTEIDVLRHSALVFSRAASVLIPARLDESPHLSIARPQGRSDRIGGVEEDEPGAEVSGGTAGVIQSLVVEVTRSIEAYRASDAGARIDHVVIAGDLGIEETLAETIHKRLDVTTEMYNPASTFGWEPDEGAGASAFAASLGLVLGHADTGLLHFDFLHPKKRVTAARERLRIAPKVAAVIALFLAAGTVFLLEHTRHERRQLAQIEAEIEELEAKADENERFLKFVDEIRAFDEQHVWVDVLHDITSLLPSREELVVANVKMDQEESQVMLKTEAKNRDTATKAIDKLAAFRREGREKQRFKVSMGAQTEKRGQEYPYRQDLKVEILDDGSVKKGSTGSKGRREG